MRRNLLAMLLAVVMIAAVVFIAAPTAKAATITVSNDNDVITVAAGDTVDLNGCENVTINVAGENGGAIYLVDSANLNDLTGESTGSAILGEGITLAENWVQHTDNLKYLAVKAEDGTYSAHPFNLTIDKIGVNTHFPAIALRAVFIADNTVAQLIDDGEFGLHNHTVDSEEEVEFTRYDKKEFVTDDGIINGIQAYFYLEGSLDSTVLENNVSNTFSAYIKLDAGYGEITIDSKTQPVISPEGILDNLASRYNVFSPADKAHLQKMMTSVPTLKNYLTGSTSTPVPVEAISTGYVKITSASQLTSGKYVLVAEGGYAPTALNGSWVEVGQPIVDKFGTITEENATAILWTLTVDGDSVILTDANGNSIAPVGGNENGIKEGEYNWAISFENGAFSFSGTGEDTVTLACNQGSGNKIKAYKSTTAESYPHTFTLYKETEIVICKHTNANPATCTEASVCKDCGVTISNALGHADANFDHVCDNGCSATQGECGDFDNDGLCDYGSSHENGCKEEYEITETPSVPDPETYTFSSYTAGTQYATEKHELSNYVTMDISNCHLTTQLRIYSSSNNNGYAIFTSKYPIASISFNMGYKVDTLNIYVSDNGTDWTLDGSVETTATSYKDYTYDLKTKSSYIKLDVDGTSQIRIASMTVTFYQAIAHDCDYSDVKVIAPTCTTPGYTTHTCSICGDSYNDSETPANGHTAGAAATCTDDQICTVCKEVLNKATGHNFVDGACTVCGAPQSTTKSWQKATSIAVGDVVTLVYEKSKMELSAISTTSTKYGTGVAYTNAPAGVMKLTVVAGSTNGTYAFKTEDGKYLYWTSGNSLNVNATLDYF